MNNILLKIKIFKNFEGNKLAFIDTLKIIFMFVVTLMTWLPFRSNNFETTLSILKSFFQLNFSINLSDLKLAFILLIILLAIDLPAYVLRSHYYLKKLPKFVLYMLVICLTIFGTLINLFISSSVNKPFIYFQF